MNRRGPLFAGIAAGVVALLTLVVLLLPKISAVHKRQSELTQAQQQEQTLRAQLAQLQQARREAKDVQRKLAQLQTKIPPTADLPSLIRLLQGAADAAAVDFLSVSPGTPSPPVTGTGVSTIPTQITAQGSPGSIPGPTAGAPTGVVPAPAPSPGASPTPSGAPTTSTGA